MQNPKIREASVEQLDELFRYCFMMVGLRANNFPNQLEAMFLHQFIRDEYGGHTVEEVRLAFRKAVKRELTNGKEPVDPNCYENFSTLYLAAIMDGYRRWASEPARKIEEQKHQQKLLLEYSQKKVEAVEWREVIEQDYQLFLKGTDNWNTWPEQHYDTLEADECFPKEAWTQKLEDMKRMAISELHRTVAALQSSKKESAPVQIAWAENLIQEYRAGTRDAEVRLAAKQWVVRTFFAYNRKLKTPTLYKLSTDAQP